MRPSLRVTVCELPHEPRALAEAWARLCEHTARHRSELVLLPEFAFVEPVWERERFDQARWVDAVARSDAWLQRLPDLEAAHVVGARPASIAGRPYNQGFLWSAAAGVTPLRRKFFLPQEPGCWEATWFERGDSAFPAFEAGALSFGLNICTELWAIETYAAYARKGVQVVLSPRATEATTSRWMAVGTVAAVRSGAFSLSSNRADPSGRYGGVGWVIGPDGGLLASTSRDSPFGTVALDLAAPASARAGYPGYVFSEGAG